jgi:hypothetical protein
MASYICRTGGQKKQNILRQKELALRGAIGRGESAFLLIKLAEKVRLAWLGVNKALTYEAEPSTIERETKATPVLLELHADKERWGKISSQEIIALYSVEPDDARLPVERKKWWDFRSR